MLLQGQKSTLFSNWSDNMFIKWKEFEQIIVVIWERQARLCGVCHLTRPGIILSIPAALPCTPKPTLAEWDEHPPGLSPVPFRVSECSDGPAPGAQRLITVWYQITDVNSSKHQENFVQYKHIIITPLAWIFFYIVDIWIFVQYEVKFNEQKKKSWNLTSVHYDPICVFHFAIFQTVCADGSEFTFSDMNITKMFFMHLTFLAGHGIVSSCECFFLKCINVSFVRVHCLVLYQCSPLALNRQKKGRNVKVYEGKLHFQL